MNYLSEEFDLSDPDLVSIFDELPLWSSYFGSTLLNKIIFQPGINILDVGCGTGFPLIELAQRSGSSCKLFGIDPWGRAVERVNYKIKTMRLTNVKVIESTAEKLPFDDEYFSLIVSNNGINNAEDQERVLNECFRTAAQDAQFVITVNLPGSMIEFYEAFEEVLGENKLLDEIIKMRNHIISKRKTLEMNIEMLKKSGFKINEVTEDKFIIRFINGTAMLNHYFIKLAFLDSWKKIVPPEKIEFIFARLEEKLNKSAHVKGELSLSIPYVCIDCRK